MADPVVTHRGTIYPWHCDHMGHMNVMWYVGKFDEATWHLLASAGLTGKRMREEGIAMVAVEQRIEYKRELLAGDLITIRSWFQEVREKALLFVHEMANEETGKIAARTFLIGVCLDAKTRKSPRSRVAWSPQARSAVAPQPLLLKLVAKPTGQFRR